MLNFIAAFQIMDPSDRNGRIPAVAGITPPRLHRCPYCPYAADFNYLLQRHVRTHTGEKPYCCPQCSYRASRKDSLKQHMTSHVPLHKREWATQSGLIWSLFLIMSENVNFLMYFQNVFLMLSLSWKNADFCYLFV